MKKNNDISSQLRQELGLDPNELSTADKSLEAFSSALALPAPPDTQALLSAKLKKLNHQARNRTTLTLDHLPLLTAQSNWLDWEEVTKGILPPNDYENVYLHSIWQDDQREVFVGWAKECIPEEVHHDIIESFVILEGTCECHIWKDGDQDKKVVRMHTGDYIEMQIGENHDIITTSYEPVKAILQWRKINS